MYSRKSLEFILKRKYELFLKTEEGKLWKEKTERYLPPNETVDLEDYIYCFYPELLYPTNLL